MAIIVIKPFLAELLLGLCILGWAPQSGGKLLVLLLELCIGTVLSPYCHATGSWTPVLILPASPRVLRNPLFTSQLVLLSGSPVR